MKTELEREVRRSNRALLARLSQFPTRITTLLVSGVMVGVIGSVLLVASHAATPAVTAEAESGSTLSTASKIGDTSASGSAAVKFGVSSGGGTCVGAAKTPGGADPWGGCFPGPNNTGIPAGTQLTTYTGPCTITTDNVIIDSKTVNCDLRLLAANIVIKNSKINGTIYNDEVAAYSFSLTDSEVDAGQADQAAVWHTNFTLLRDNIYGGETTVSCNYNCSVADSYLHGQGLIQGISEHLGGFLANSGGGPNGTNVNFQHNTVGCDATTDSSGGGCSGDINIWGDFGTPSNETINKSLVLAWPDVSYCIYGGSVAGKTAPDADHIVITNNIIQKGTTGHCGGYGAVSNFDSSRLGNVWSNNLYDDGTTLNP